MRQMSIKYWLLSGGEENWEAAIDYGGIWGVREGRLKSLWTTISPGDILFFYCKSPIGGVTGFGKTRAKFKQDKPLWPDEVRVNRVIYPYRWEFEVVFILPKPEWRERKIVIRDLPIGIQAGLNPTRNKDAILELVSRMKQSWGIDVIEEPMSQFMEKTLKKETPNLHEKIKNLLLDLGKLNGYVTDKEYVLDGQRVDVVWKRIEKGAPTYVFEVQIGGNVTEALGKLKHAFDLYNSNLYVIIKEKDRVKVEALLSGTFHEIENKLTVILVGDIEGFYEIKVAEAKLKERLGLP